MLTKIKSIAATAYSYTHIFVGAGAVVTSFLDSQQLPPKFAAGVVIASQGLRVLSDWITVAHTAAPVALKVAQQFADQARSVAVLPSSTPLAPVVPVPAPAPAPLEPAAPTQSQVSGTVLT